MRDYIAYAEQGHCGDQKLDHKVASNIEGANCGPADRRHYSGQSGEVAKLTNWPDTSDPWRLEFESLGFDLHLKTCGAFGFIQSKTG